MLEDHKLFPWLETLIINSSLFQLNLLPNNSLELSRDEEKHALEQFGKSNGNILCLTSMFYEFSNLFLINYNLWKRDKK